MPLFNVSAKFSRAAVAVAMGGGLIFSPVSPALAAEQLTAAECKAKYGPTEQGVVCAMKDLQRRKESALQKIAAGSQGIAEGSQRIASANQQIAVAENTSADALAESAAAKKRKGCVNDMQQIFLKNDEGKREVFEFLKGRKMSQVNDPCAFFAQKQQNQQKQQNPVLSLR
ncbi:hypothetical protein JDN40_02280 [Rhodomicrobium vannielii ATCC 17100]|uniref:hypothetical protein n=1 Tax=Rhodomicrobium vannielii TaxID=1069 RepID=UPI00191B0C1C|nr:hypothetical protein [Rhodomicrobium vannielii]MBJ7532942.1 hypothetical protein [Rhodomicrobium vannielii ATCC 17100]